MIVSHELMGEIQELGNNKLSVGGLAYPHVDSLTSVQRANALDLPH